jgi:deoxyribonuclease V
VIWWPSTPEALSELQRELAAAAQEPFSFGSESRVGGCFACFVRGEHGPGHPGDRAWAAASVDGEVAVVRGEAGAAYQAGLLALREGALLARAVEMLGARPDVLLVDATGRDHPRRAGLALHLGAALGLPTVGVTHRPLVAEGAWPPDEPGAASPLVLEGERVGAWVRTRPGTRPLAVHAAWRTDVDVAVEVVRAVGRGMRTPAPLRASRRAAREARAGDSSPPAPVQAEKY